MKRLWAFVKAQRTAIAVGATVAGLLYGGQFVVAAVRGYAELKAEVAVLKAWAIRIQQQAAAQAQQGK